MLTVVDIDIDIDIVVTDPILITDPIIAVLGPVRDFIITTPVGSTIRTLIF
jgi:hypothetical protein